MGAAGGRRWGGRRGTAPGAGGTGARRSRTAATPSPAAWTPSPWSRWSAPPSPPTATSWAPPPGGCAASAAPSHPCRPPARPPAAKTLQSLPAAFSIDSQGDWGAALNELSVSCDSTQNSAPLQDSDQPSLSEEALPTVLASTAWVTATLVACCSLTVYSRRNLPVFIYSCCKLQQTFPVDLQQFSVSLKPYSSMEWNGIFE